ncbi:MULTISPECIES: efflux RND transporter permease subunit [unclassified Paenibacillus]|uniref:efflux RND transporter permease subunit n=1 Tax=unclassified Paenibacillus TaxID=185978 RepID=UPI000953E8AA|nr:MULTISPECIES: efflux RND transporter permease subunit [unclassified Paenibacillus]ASS65630.1 efflux RND transporter permease subunit [Paenibacillus sp. RUD330]SIQ29147.1 hydrophobic/amphiphilic exporter-1, HAE1 family [Paenibacillus sp. RU4X]SIQ51252.1 hydrophobic/amphiphilic exporter-1, HAE1 family [Paenibacillus sp. RU4T]
MKSIIRFSINNKFALWLMTLIVVFGGVYAGTNMKMETLPDITVPIVSVTTVYPGASPEEVLESVTKPVEQATRNLDGVKEVSSTSYENASSIVIEYGFGKDMEKAQQEVREALGSLKLKDGVQDPSVSRLSLNAFPVASLSISSSKENLAALTKTVEDDIVPELKGLEGVASIQISGQHVEDAELSYKADELAKYGLTPESVQNAVKAAAVNVPLGIFTFGSSEKSIVVDGQIMTADDLLNIEIPLIPSAAGAGAGGGAGAGAAAGGAGQAAPDQGGAAAAGGITLPTVKLSQVADVTVTGKADSISRTNGKDSIGVSVVKAADANTVDVTEAVKSKMDELTAKYDGLTSTVTLDQGKPIKDSVETMLTKAILGAAFAILIILLFLRDIRSTIISVVSIPLSLLIAVLVLQEFDITLNIMTLGAMTVAIGRVVDDSIVVIENIYRRMAMSSEKLTGRELIISATREMFVPIAASTIVTIAVFLPLGFVSGMIGEIFLPFALTMVFSLLASLVVAVTVVPMLAHMMFRNGLKGTKHEDKPSRLANGYKRVLRWCLDHKGLSFGAAVLLLVGSLFLTPLIGVSFISSGGDNSMIITYNPAPGETAEDVEGYATNAEKEIMGREGVEIVQYSIGGSNPFSPGASKQALFNIRYNSDFKHFEDEKKAVVELLQKNTSKGEWKQQDFGGGGLGGSSLTVTAYGPDMKELEPVVNEISDKLKSVSNLSNVDTSLSKTYEQYRIAADTKKLSQHGLSAGQLAMALSPVREQPVLTTIEKDGEKLNVHVKTEVKTYADKAALENALIPTPLGGTVKLGDVATIEEGTTPNTVTRKGDRIYASVTADVTSSDISKASKDVQKVIDELKLPSNVDVEMGGVTEDIGESFKQLGLAIAVAIAVVYLVLVITFGGALTPLTILFSLPFTVIGALVGLLIAKETISVTALIGMLMLIGIVVTNAIVLIDRVIHMEREGMSVRDALLEAGGTRLRPILMTAIATVGALLPLAFGFESGALISKGLGVTVIGGLTSSTLLTLIIVPVVYEFLNRRRAKRQRSGSLETAAE